MISAACRRRNLAQVGEQALRDHLVAQAVVAHHRYGSLSADRLDEFLRDPQCLRHPVRLVYEFGEMAMHQFAHVDADWRGDDPAGKVLYLRPGLRGEPAAVVLAVAYMVPVLNYRDVASDGHCLLYGATLLGLTVDEFYRAICTMADGLGAAARLPGDPAFPPPCGSTEG